tara:strand:+ start:289938 stop:292700 length:2763 start_codon:yes stop_codon:yes gene_type:complete
MAVNNSGAFILGSLGNTFQVNKKAVAKAVLLPGVLPRLKDLFTSPLIFLAYGYAYLFFMVKLLPASHPYLQKKNFGKYGIFHVLGAASEKLEFNLQNIDRVIAYFAVMASLVILIILGLMALAFVIVGQAWSQSPFVTPNPTNDVALMMLDATFGIPDIFCTTSGAVTNCSKLMETTPSPFHAAMQNSLFGVYNSLFLIIAVILLSIYILHAIFDTIQSGTAFGQKFNSFWGPFRLLIGIGLLLPVNYGMNSGQYIVLYAAKFGSGMATNAWHDLTDKAGIPIGGVEISAASGLRNLLTEPSVPDYNALIGFMHMVKACEYFYEHANDGHPEFDKDIQPYQIYGESSASLDSGLTFSDALLNSQNGPINIRFGHRAQPDASGNMPPSPYLGSVDPLCGEVTIDVNNATIPGATAAYEVHYAMIQVLYNIGPINAYAAHVNHLHGAYTPLAGGCPSAPDYSGLVSGCQTGIPPDYAGYYYDPGNPIQLIAASTATSALTELSNANELIYSTALRDRGWAGAGLWYGRVSDLNGTMMEAVGAVPSATMLPKIVGELFDKKKQNDKDSTASDLFEPVDGEGKPISVGSAGAGEERLLPVINETYKRMLAPDSALAQSTVSDTSALNIIETILNMIFGTAGISNMNENSDTHALFQLTAIGKGLIETSIRNLLSSTIASAGGGFLSQMDSPAAKVMGNVSSTAAGFASMIGQITLSAGIILYYIVPLMPFMYFFFACGRWVKSVFEALVGVPLWALAHMKYEGEGIGDMATSGYYLIFEIFIRPILIVFGLIAALSIFGAMVAVLNDIWSLVTANLSGYDYDGPAGDIDSARGRLDQLFFTIFYVIVIYVMAQTSFKLIDMIPNQILRWMGSSTSSFGDMTSDPIEGLTQTAAITGAQMIPQATGAASRGAAGLGGVAGKLGRG